MKIRLLDFRRDAARSARLLTAALATMLAPLLATGPVAAAYPERQVRVIVAFSPGGAVDVVARIAAQQLTQRLGQSFYVENIAGATGNIGTAQAARAAPDGHTLLVAFSSHVVNPSLFDKLPYDPVKDFEPVALMVIAANVLVVSTSVEARTVDELIALVRAHPAKYNYAATTNTQAHLLGEQFRRTLQLDLVHVPFNGAGPAIASVVGGHTPIGFATLASAISQIEAGQLRALAMLSSKRVSTLPDVPTMAEAGHPRIEGDVWIAALAPVGTPAEIVDLLNRELNGALARPDVARILLEQGLSPTASTPAQLGQRIKDEIGLWRRIVETTRTR